MAYDLGCFIFGCGLCFMLGKFTEGRYALCCAIFGWALCFVFCHFVFAVIFCVGIFSITAKKCIGCFTGGASGSYKKCGYFGLAIIRRFPWTPS